VFIKIIIELIKCNYVFGWEVKEWGFYYSITQRNDCKSVLFYIITGQYEKVRKVTY